MRFGSKALFIVSVILLIPSDDLSVIRLCTARADGPTSVDADERRQFFGLAIKQADCIPTDEQAQTWLGNKNHRIKLVTCKSILSAPDLEAICISCTFF